MGRCSYWTPGPGEYLWYRQYVYMNFFIIFMPPQPYQIRVFQGHGVVGISFTGHPAEFFFLLLHNTIDSDILYNVEV
jgi:hypothetical protein